MADEPYMAMDDDLSDGSDKEYREGFLDEILQGGSRDVNDEPELGK